MAGVGNCVFVDEDKTIFAGYHSIIARPGIANIFLRYFAYLFLSDAWRSQIRSYVNGVKVYSITQKLLGDSDVIIPPLSEQTAIASFLDKKCALIDSITNDIERQIEILKQYKLSLITETVTKGLNKDVKMKESGVEWIGKIPEGWDIKPLKYITICNQKTLPETTAKEYTFRYIDIGSVTFDDGIFQYENMNFEFAPSRARRVVSVGDVIISTVRTYLKAITQITDADNVIVSTGFAVFTPKPMVDSTYLVYYSKSNGFVSEISRLSRGVSYPAIDTSTLSNILALLPPLSEQKSIAAYLDRRCSKIDAVITDKQTQLDTLKKHKQSLIYEYVTGKKRVPITNEAET